MDGDGCLVTPFRVGYVTQNGGTGHRAKLRRYIYV